MLQPCSNRIIVLSTRFFAADFDETEGACSSSKLAPFLVILSVIVTACNFFTFQPLHLFPVVLMFPVIASPPLLLKVFVFPELNTVRYRLAAISANYFLRVLDQVMSHSVDLSLKSPASIISLSRFRIGFSISSSFFREIAVPSFGKRWQLTKGLPHS